MLKELERTPSGWGSGYSGISIMMCEQRRFRTFCELFPKEAMGETKTITGVEIHANNIKLVRAYGSNIRLHPENEMICWVERYNKL